MKNFLKRILEKSGYHISRIDPPSVFFDMVEQEFHTICDAVRPYTMTSIEKMYALYQAVLYIELARIPGDLVECGVWKGGSQMLAAKTLQESRSFERRLYLYDTFEGMDEPTDKDQHGFEYSSLYHDWVLNRRTAHETWKAYNDKGEGWLSVPLSDVEQNMRLTGYPIEKIHFVKGTVEDTLPSRAPEEIAILRVDVDWYKPTLHALTHLYPRLSLGGVLILDDYGSFLGAREAVDQYFSEQHSPPLFVRIDSGGRVAIKMP
jgi:O-methyltransferase